MVPCEIDEYSVVQNDVQDFNVSYRVCGNFLNLELVGFLTIVYFNLLVAFKA